MQELNDYVKFDNVKFPWKNFLGCLFSDVKLQSYKTKKVNQTVLHKYYDKRDLRLCLKSSKIVAVLKRIYFSK